jgi:hypothetical protein
MTVDLVIIDEKQEQERFDRAAMRELGISGEELIERYLANDLDQFSHGDLMRVLILAPGKKSHNAPDSALRSVDFDDSDEAVDYPVRKSVKLSCDEVGPW